MLSENLILTTFYDAYIREMTNKSIRSSILIPDEYQAIKHVLIIRGH